MAKFASITADLLARKGEARPWGPTPVAASWPAAHVAGPTPSNATATGVFDGHHSCDGTRKLTVRLSEGDYECLGIIAAKRDITRQTLLRQLLDGYLSEAAEIHRASCGCIGSTCRR